MIQDEGCVAQVFCILCMCAQTAGIKRANITFEQII